MKRLVIALAVIAMLVPLGALAWVSMDDNATPPHTVWPSLPIQYYLNDDGCADIGGFAPTETIVLDSFATWSDPVCTLWDTYYRGSTTRRPNPDGRQVIAWQESSWPHSSSAIGVCEVYFSSSHVIGEADIRMNAEDFRWNTTGSGGVDTQSICTHEMGHFLGLGDLYGGDCDMGQTMCGTYGGGRSKRTLTTDDIDGVCNLYPTGCTTPSDCPAGFDCVGGSCVPLPSDVCAPCDYHGECGGPEDYCLSGFPDGHTYCGRACTTSTDCDWGYVCVTLTGGTERSCVPYNMSCDPPPMPECEFDTDCPALSACIDMLCVGGLCAPCTDNYDCGSTDDYCILTGFTDGGSYCGTRCVSSTECPFGFQCITVSGGIMQCVPMDYDCATPPERECWTDDDCPEGQYCELGYCREAPECFTSDDCPEGEICVDDECIPDPRPHLPLCAECTSHNECGEHEDLCIGGFLDGTQRCGFSCDSVGGDCGEGLTCYEFPEVPDQCLPSTMDCSTFCDTDDDCPPGSHCEERRCTDVCDLTAADPCPDGFYCDATSCTAGNCAELPAEPGTLQVGEICGTDHDCESLDCSDFLGTSTCTERCDWPSSDACPAHASCQPIRGGECGICACAAGILGDVCSGFEECQAGTCANGYCTRACTDSAECPTGFSCNAIGETSYCMPGIAGMGQECQYDEQCATGLCTEYEGVRFCTRSCDDTGCTCPGSYMCIDSRCVTQMDVEPDKLSGCGCTLVDRSGSALWPALLLAAALLLGLLRRRI